MISILGIFLLLIISASIQPEKISGYSELKENKYVQVSGKIISIKNYEDFSILKLDSNITLTCNCKFQANSTVTAQGKVEKYQNNLQVNADKIEIRR